MCIKKQTVVKPLETPIYFGLDEFLHSEVAVKNKIENTPSWEVAEHLRELALFLDGIREAWSGGIIVTSGFRTPDLNKKVGGVGNSVHMIGYAADIIPANGDLDGFEEFLKEYLEDKDYDQCIWERSGNVRWIHLSIFNNKGEQRHMMFELTA